MRISKNWFLVKRPYTRVLSKSKKYIERFPSDLKLDSERGLLKRRLGYEDGYVECLKDLGINQTGENMKMKSKN
jgi:hypothetical protein